MTIKVADFVFKELAALGVEQVFMLPGGGCMHLVDSLGNRPEIDYVCCLHEQGVAIAAEAYGQYTNHLGVALVTTGPGGTNALTGVAGAWIDSTPMLVISGQAKREDMIRDRGVRQMGIQEVDIVSMVKPITKYAVTVLEPERIKFELRKALSLATSGRKGPVWLDIPLDVQGAMVDEDALPAFVPDAGTPCLAGDAQLQRLAELLGRAKRPAFLLGNGVRLAGSLEACRRLVERVGAPVLTSWKMADFIPEDHPLYCGRPGIVGQRGANFVQQTCDCLVVLGSRLDLCQTGFNHPNFAPHAKKIVVDVDLNEIAKLDMPLELGIEENLATFIERFLPLAPVCSCASWLAACKGWHATYPVVLPEYRQGDGPVNTYHLIDVFSDLLGEGDVLVPASSGAAAELVPQALRVRKGLRYLNTPGLGSMGFDLPAAIGACLASGGKRTICLAGDGGFQMNIQELATLKRLNLPVKLFVLNNDGYGSIRGMQTNRFAGHLVACDSSSGLVLPDVCKQAEAIGLASRRLVNQKNLAAEVAEVLDTPGPVVCEVLADPNVPTAPRLSSEVLPDGRIVSKPMEDLFPFLPREEFVQVMAVTN
jgi:acetolactate synthase-1/2/3 large subunit